MSWRISNLLNMISCSHDAHLAFCIGDFQPQFLCFNRHTIKMKKSFTTKQFWCAQWMWLWDKIWPYIQCHLWCVWCNSILKTYCATVQLSVPMTLFIKKYFTTALNRLCSRVQETHLGSTGAIFTSLLSLVSPLEWFYGHILPLTHY